MPQDDSDVNIDELTKSAADNQAIIDAKKAFGGC